MFRRAEHIESTKLNPLLKMFLDSILRFFLFPGSEHNFDLYGASKVDNLGVEYDYVSCMHYGPYSFTANGAPTIEPLEVCYFIRNIFFYLF